MNNRMPISADEERKINHMVKKMLGELFTPAPKILDLATAQEMAKLAEQEAKNIGIAAVICIMDMGANLILLHRMDDSLLGSVTLAQNKARTAVAFKKSTQELARACQPGGELYGLQNQPDVSIVGGGLPCYRGTVQIGGIGVSGGSVDEDIRIATKALSYL